MKRILVAALAVFLLFFPLTSHAEGEEYLSEFSSLLPEGISLADGEDLSESVGIEAFFTRLFSVLSGERPALVSLALFSLGLTFLLALSEALSDTFGDMPKFGAEAVCACLLFSELSSLLSETAAGLSEASSFFRGVIPLLTAVHAAGGNVSSAAGSALSGALVFEVLNTLTVQILPPLAGAVLALGLFGSLSPENGVSAPLSSSVKTVITRVFGWLTLIFSFALGLQTAVGTAQDTVTLRAAKYAASSALPIVGNAVSGALGSLVSSLAYVRSVIGICGVFVILSLAAPLLVRLLAVRLILGFCGGLLSFSGGKSRLFDAFSGAVDVLTAATAFSSFLMILETALTVRGTLG